MRSVQPLPLEERQSSISVELNGIQRPTEELVIGMVGPIGAGVSTTSELVAKILATEFGYAPVTIVKVSDIINDNCGKIALSHPPSPSGTNRVKFLQEAGSKLRSKFGDRYLVGKVIEDISLSRSKEGGYLDTENSQNPKSLRRATIIDSLKHPDESKLLRETYGGMYWQFSIFAPETVRERRLKRQGMEKTQLPGIFTQDEGDIAGDHGQKVSDTAHLSDFFVRNDADNKDELTRTILRFLDIAFGVTIYTPNHCEMGMYTAVSSATQSACLSRQVGASIYSEAHELISTGWNDVPKFGGGLYSDGDEHNDHRCFKWMSGICHNDHRKEALYEEVFDKLEGLFQSGTNYASVREQLKKTRLKQIIEYSRSIHAEMQAIVSAARVGKEKLEGGTLFTTTFPCHNCARHIVASGIREVYYIEPYSKSLALDLHDDSISLEKGDGKVPFLQYEGVGPSVAMKLFSAQGDRKHEGRARTVVRKDATPILPPPLDGFTEHEKRVTVRITALEARAEDNA